MSPGALLSGPRAAQAAVAIQLSLDELVAAASYVVVATATEQYSRWEELGGAKRIVTYTRLSIDRTVAGQPDADVWVRTLGGIVGDIGQHVAGDAQLRVGAQAMVFVSRASSALVVSGMAQGHYPIVDAEETQRIAGAPRIAVRRLAASPSSGTVLARPGPAISAREQLVGATVDAAIDAVSRAWKAKHAQQ
ncbi:MULTISPECIES: hypothetical protein [Sorangium]|uniref:hypothetical protein n=1 Tax=Sorangium TaxID=39643 RepID=UPI001F289BC4|nr:MULTISPECIES: hypothetical protein [Sorangium]